MATATNLVPHPIFLAGRWVDSPDLLTIDNPARPGEPAGFTYQATPEQYEEAVAGRGRRVRGDPQAARLRARRRSCATSARASGRAARSSAG